MLLDKARFPREKPCGGALSVRSLNALKFARIRLPKSIIEQKIYGLQLIGPEGIPFEYRSARVVAYTVKRSQFDNFLANRAVKAGAHFEQECAVNDVEQYSDRVLCHTEKGRFEGKLVIGADGATSIIGRKVGPRKQMKPKEIGLAIEADVPVSETIWDQSLDPSLLVIWLPYIPRGYFWVFPRKNSLSVGLGGLATKLGNVPNLLRGLSRRFCEQFGLPPFTFQNLRGHLLPFFENLISLTNQRVLLVGDSAGFIDVFSGQGICYALEGGLIAARTVIDVIKHHETLSEASSSYQCRIQQRFGEELRCSWLIMRIVHARPYGGFRAARFMKWPGPTLFDIGRGKTDYYRMIRNPLGFLYNLFKFELQIRLMKTY